MGELRTRGAVVLQCKLNLKREDQDRKVLAIYMRRPPEWEYLNSSFMQDGAYLRNLTISGAQLCNLS